jgi:hypothetical protein
MKKLYIPLIACLSQFIFMGAQLNTTQETEFCKVLKQIVAASQENFEPIKKERKSGMIDLYYTSSVALPTSSDTKIILSGESWYMMCKLQEKNDLEQVKKNYNQLSGVIRSCFKNWKQTFSTEGKLNTVEYKDNTDRECGSKVKLSIMENVAKVGYYKITLSVYPN